MSRGGGGTVITGGGWEGSFRESGGRMALSISEFWLQDRAGPVTLRI